MKQSNVKILSQEELKVRYHKNTEIAKHTREALEEGFLIVLIEQQGLHASLNLACDIIKALKSISITISHVELEHITDMSDLSEDKVYYAIKPESISNL